MSNFILELGIEELPARFLSNLQKDLKEAFEKTLKEQGIDFKEIKVATTPRRAAVIIEQIAENAHRFEELVSGPPKKIAFMENGEPSKAGLGFAKTQGVDFNDTFILETEKGDYLAVKKQMGGGKTLDNLPAICLGIIQGLSFPKRMHWGDSEDFTFARPLRWILALYENKVVEFKIAGVSSGRQTFGHRILGVGPFELTNANEYLKIIAEKAKVVLFPEERLKIIKEKANALAQNLSEFNGAKIIWKESLLNEVCGLVEHPVPLIGYFDPSFLEVPREVLLTSMESHQKSFGLEDANGDLLPAFLTVANISSSDESLVRKGWERVLRARLEDARFFWKADLKTSVDTWLDKLDNVIFLAPLGSMGDKTRRLEKLCVFIAQELGLKQTGFTLSDLERAGRLSKADLVSEMVKEFDTLQGIMGGIYATKRGENEFVSQALKEQYLPAGVDSPVPTSLSGAILSLADKADTLVGCFGLGMIPTGTADPYALRRAVLGIIRIFKEHAFTLKPNILFKKAFELYGDKKWKLNQTEALAKLDDFFALRLKNYFCASLNGLVQNETLLVEASLAAGYNDIALTEKRINALAEFSKNPEFANAVLTFKRAANIIRKQGQEEDFNLDGKYKSELFSEQAEKDLAKTLEAINPRFEKLWQAHEFSALFALLFELKPSVEIFFEQVMVMAEDKNIRYNRLQLLSSLVALLSSLADFNALQI